MTEAILLAKAAVQKRCDLLHVQKVSIWRRHSEGESTVWERMYILMQRMCPMASVTGMGVRKLWFKHLMYCCCGFSI